MRPSPKKSAHGRGGGRKPKRDEKLVTSEATTTPDEGESSAEGGAGGGGGVLNLPLLGQGGCGMALRPSACPPPRTGRPGSREEQGMGRGEDSLSGQGPDGVLGGPTPPQCGVPRGGGGDRLWLLPGVRVGRGRRVRRWEWRLGGEDGPAGGLLVASGVRQGRGFRVEGEARSDPGWPALARCLAELARVALWLAPRLRVDLLRLLGRCLCWRSEFSLHRRIGGRRRYSPDSWGS